MASNIKFKRSAVQNRVPTTAQLDLGELALNTYDGKLYTEINTGSAAVVEIGSKLSSLVVDGANGAGGGDVVFHGTTAGKDLTWDYSDNSLNLADNTFLKILEYLKKIVFCLSIFCMFFSGFAIDQSKKVYKNQQKSYKN